MNKIKSDRHAITCHGKNTRIQNKIIDVLIWLCIGKKRSVIQSSKDYPYFFYIFFTEACHFKLLCIEVLIPFRGEIF